MAKKLLGEIELNRIYQRDCIEGMRMIPDKSVNLIVIDPPYNIGKDARWDKWKSVDEYIAWMGVVFAECERVLADNGSFYWFHNDIAQMRKLMDALDSDTSFIFKQFVVWNKRFDGARNKGFLDGFVEVGGLRNYQQMTEYCAFYTFQDNTGLSNVMLDVNNFSTLRGYFRELQVALGTTKKAIIDAVGQRADHCFRWNSTQWDLPTPETYAEILKLPVTSGFPPREYESLRLEYESLRLEYESLRYTYNNQKTHHSVWNYEIAPKLGHITPKPVDLIENIIAHSSNPGDIVLDCFLGSGTTAVAALNLGRNFIGFEREPAYIEIANQRLDSINLTEDALNASEGSVDV